MPALICCRQLIITGFSKQRRRCQAISQLVFFRARTLTNRTPVARLDNTQFHGFPIYQRNCATPRTTPEPLFIAAGRAEVSSLSSSNRPEEPGGLWPGIFYDLTPLQELIVFILVFVIRRLFYTMDRERYAVPRCDVN